ncbi:aldo/keto reductase [Streptomyces lydicus]|uniref:aldo/keto reductase n=1 Tax=Streptomyces lydicus TaxID=47763 RepID=UPI0037A99001
MHPTLGPGGPVVSRLGLGCMSMTGSYSPADPHEAAATLLQALDCGVTLFDTGDVHYGAGIAHGEDLYEHGGFTVHLFDRDLFDALAAGWTLNEVHAFEEGELPRRLWRVTQTVPR